MSERKCGIEQRGKILLVYGAELYAPLINRMNFENVFMSEHGRNRRFAYMALEVSQFKGLFAERADAHPMLMGVAGMVESGNIDCVVLVFADPDTSLNLGDLLSVRGIYDGTERPYSLAHYIQAMQDLGSSVSA